MQESKVLQSAGQFWRRRTKRTTARTGLTSKYIDTWTRSNFLTTFYHTRSNHRSFSSRLSPVLVSNSARLPVESLFHNSSRSIELQLETKHWSCFATVARQTSSTMELHFQSAKMNTAMSIIYPLIISTSLSGSRTMSAIHSQISTRHPRASIR